MPALAAALLLAQLPAQALRAPVLRPGLLLRPGALTPPRRRATVHP